MSKRVLCKFYAHGACLKGEHCEFSHEWKDSPNNICTFYQKGICSYGSRCRYEHVKVSRSHSSASSSSANSHQSLIPNSASITRYSRTASSGVTGPGGVTELSASSKPFFPPTEPVWNVNSGHFDGLDVDDDVVEARSDRPEDQPICSFAAAGNCPRGEKCPHIHGDLCPNCGKHCLHPFRREGREEHIKACEKKQKHLESLRHSQEIECSVCLDRVLSKPTAAERKFGLLSECDHPFCISCIRNWRSSSPTSGMDVNSALRSCPICRKLSYFVVPSVIWYSTKEEKQEIIDNYKAKLRSIDCKHFDFGNGNCPFGTSCFYKHTVKPGSYAWIHGRPPPRRRPPRRRPMHRSNVGDIDAIDDMFEHLFMDSLMDEEDLDFFDAEDLDAEDLMPVDMALLLMQLSFGMSDSSDEDT